MAAGGGLTLVLGQHGLGVLPTAMLPRGTRAGQGESPVCWSWGALAACGEQGCMSVLNGALLQYGGPRLQGRVVQSLIQAPAPQPLCCLSRGRVQAPLQQR